MVVSMDVKPFRAPFIVGAPRSGTTLLRLMLDAHPDLAIPAETAFIPALLAESARKPLDRPRFLKIVTEFSTWQDFHLSSETLAHRLDKIEPFTLADGLRAFYSLYAERFGKSRWGDKTPDYGFHTEGIGAVLPEARFVHIIRDGRDVAVSLRNLWFAPSRDFAVLAADWVRRIRSLRGWGRERPDYLEIRYEELVAVPEIILRTVCNYLNLVFDPCQLEHHRNAESRIAEHEGRKNSDGHWWLTKEARRAQQSSTLHPAHTGRIGLWKTVFSPEDHARFLQNAGELLRELGYEIQ